MREEITNWLDHSKRDLDTAHYLFDGKRYEEAALFCQQATEKAIKALFLNNENKIIKTHDLIFLGEKVKLPEKFREVCKELSLIYLFVRYPDTSEIKNIRKKASYYLESAKEILRWVKDQL